MKKAKIIIVIIITAIVLFSGNLKTFGSVIKTGKVEIKYNDSTFEKFAEDAPIATITIDKTKINGKNVEIDTSRVSTSKVSKVYINNDGYIVAENVAMKNGYTSIGTFVLKYKDACIMSDGTTKDLEVAFENTTFIGNSNHSTEYKDTMIIIKVGTGTNFTSPAIAPISLSSPREYFAFRPHIRVRVGSAGEVDENETFLFTVNGIEVKRDGGNFRNITDAQGHYYYSESVEPFIDGKSKVNDESDIYVAWDSEGNIDVANNQASGTDIKNGTYTNSYGYRFVANGKGIPGRNYSSGFATVASSQGFMSRYWSSGGTPTGLTPLELYIMPMDIDNTITSASGENGKIELNTQGYWESDGEKPEGSRLLEGGETLAKRMYTVARGKNVTYKMTPNIGYKIKTLATSTQGDYTTLYENGQTETNGTTNFDALVDYYTFTFSDINQNQTIDVEWELIEYPINYKLDGGTNNSGNPSTYNIEDEITLLDPTKEGYKFLGWKEGKVIPQGSTLSKTFTAQWEKKPDPVVENPSDDIPNNEEPVNKQEENKQTIEKVEEPSKSPKTGDQIALWIILIVASLAGLYIVLIKPRKNKRKN